MRQRSGAGFLREAGWITADRVQAAAPLFLLGMIALAVYWALSGVAFEDFTSFWAASALTLRGMAAKAYNPAVHQSIEATLPGITGGRWSAFLYPPIFLLVCAPLALLPFFASAFLWVAATWCLFAASIRPLLPGRLAGTCAALAFPAAWFNAAPGQNGFLSAGLLVFGLTLLDRRPILAGLLLGCLAYKPQFGIVLPFALIASGRWRATVSAAATVLVLAVTSVLAFGLTPWIAFARETTIIRDAVGGLEPLGKLLSATGAAAWLGAPPAVGLAAQILTTTAACLGIAVFARRYPNPRALTAAVCVAAAAASPWLHGYDLTVLAWPVAWLVRSGRRTGFLPWEKSVALIAYLGPLAILPLTKTTHLPITLLTLAALAAAVIGRARAEPIVR